MEKYPLPTDTGSYNAERFITNLVLLVKHHPVRWTTFRLEGLLSVVDRPLELLCRDKKFAKDGIDASLTAVQAGYPSDCFLVVQNKLEKRPQDSPSLNERSLGPLPLSRCCFRDDPIDSIWSRWIDKT